LVLRLLQPLVILLDLATQIVVILYLLPLLVYFDILLSISV